VHNFEYNSVRESPDPAPAGGAGLFKVQGNSLLARVIAKKQPHHDVHNFEY
jgi:hypothetical protein